MAQLLDSLNVYRAEVLEASTELLKGLGHQADFPASHDPADIVLDTLDIVSEIEGTINGEQP